MANKYFAVVQKFLQESAKGPGFNRTISVWKPVSVSEGRLRVEFDVTEDLTNPFKTLHGGITASFIDIATVAATIATPRGINPVAVSLNINYLSPAKLGDTVVIDAWVSRLGKSLAYAEVEMFRKHDNVMVAKALQVNAFPAEKPDKSVQG